MLLVFGRLVLNSCFVINILLPYVFKDILTLAIISNAAFLGVFNGLCISLDSFKILKLSQHVK